MKPKFGVKHLLASVITISVIVILNQGALILSYVFGSPYVFTVHPYVHLASSLTPCLQSTKNFVGHEKVVRHKTMEFQHLENIFNESLPGGHFIPNSCQSRAKIAIIIPYRDRKSHLIHYLYNVIPKLQRQQIEFTIFVVEQATGSMFNRGMMRNIGFKEAREVADYDCFVFNDVDTIPEDDRNIFDCSKSRIRHLVSGIDRYHYRLPYSELLGGILAFSPSQFITVNGYSNLFFIWGAEDDDIFRRVINMGYLIERPPRPIGYVTTLKHDREPISDLRLRLFDVIENSSKNEGLNSLKYKKIKMEFRKLFTWIYVDIDETTVKEHFWSKI